MSDTELFGLLASAEYAAESGFPVESLRVTKCPQSDETLLVLDSVEEPLPDQAFSSYTKLCNLKKSILTGVAPGSPVPKLPTPSQPSHIPPSSIRVVQSGSQNLTILEGCSPSSDLPPKALFSEDVDISVDSSQGLCPASGGGIVGVWNSLVLHDQVEVLNIQNSNKRHEIPSMNGDVVYYWVTNTHRSKQNFALRFACEISRELRIPLIVMV